MKQNRPSLVIGASENPERYSNMAIKLLKKYGHTVYALGKREGEVDSIKIETDKNLFDDKPLDTITLYVNPNLQKEYMEDILKWKPKRVIFNPGTENEVFETVLEANGIEPIEACTLVMLKTNQFD
jgi:predicted CoA-binding protein